MREKFLRYLRLAVRHHCVYIWGAQGQKVAPLTEDDIRKMETSEKNVNRVIQFIMMLDWLGWLTKKTLAFDCSGLICYYLSKVGRENKGFDMRADDLYNHYPKSEILEPGMLVHRSGHIGVYIGYNHVIEARGRDWGVVPSPFNKEDWDKLYANPWVA